jgi:hypothetical protein
MGFIGKAPGCGWTGPGILHQRHNRFIADMLLDHFTRGDEIADGTATSAAARKHRVFFSIWFR